MVWHIASMSAQVVRVVLVEFEEQHNRWLKKVRNLQGAEFPELFLELRSVAS